MCEEMNDETAPLKWATEFYLLRGVTKKTLTDMWTKEEGRSRTAPHFLPDVTADEVVASCSKVTATDISAIKSAPLHFFGLLIPMPDRATVDGLMAKWNEAAKAADDTVDTNTLCVVISDPALIAEIERVLPVKMKEHTKCQIAADSEMLQKKRAFEQMFVMATLMELLARQDAGRPAPGAKRRRRDRPARGNNGEEN